VALIGALAVPAHGAGGDTGGAPRVTGPVGKQTKGGKPVSGGTLHADVSIGEPGGLDPIKGTPDGDLGLSEYAAIFDVLLRYDPVTRKYSPQLAKSISANADNTAYTVTLRDGVKFTDGTPLNAAAVKYSVERYKGPGSAQYYFAVMPEIASIDTPDDLTVVFNLTTSDAQFPWLLSQGLGLIVSPTAVEQMGADAFNLAPVGAGPFKVEKYTPGSELDVVRNDDYWGQKPYLDGIHFTWPKGDSSKVQALDNGDLDIVHVLDPAVIAKALGSGGGGYMWLRYGGNGVVFMNTRDGHQTSDVDLRKAVTYALSPEVINTRLYNGQGYPSSDLFPSGALASGVKGLGYRPAQAKKLVAQVKQKTGWDGSIRLLTAGDATTQGFGLTIQALLNAAGMKVTIDAAPSVSDFVSQVYLKNDYDLALAADNISESDPWAQLVGEVSGPFNPSGISSDQMVAVLGELQAATSPAQVKTATGKLQKLWNQLLPEAWTTVAQDTVLSAKQLRGVVPTANSTVLLGTAWLAK
jgi:peptide/nickel transport system substrate-binding protein